MKGNRGNRTTNRGRGPAPSLSVRYEIRLTEEQGERFKRAAQIDGFMLVSQWLRSLAERRCLDVEQTYSRALAAQERK